MTDSARSTHQDSISLPLREAAKLVGCSLDTLKRAVDDGALPAFRLGRGRKKPRWFVKRQTLLDWIDSLERTGG